MRTVTLFSLLSLFVSAGYSQSISSPDVYSSSLLSNTSSDGSAMAAAPSSISSGIIPPAAVRTGPFSAIAIGAKAGLLGVGLEAATPLSSHLNLRGGGNAFNFSDTFSTDGVSYNANLQFRSAETSVDWFPWARAFHISPGALLYNGNNVTANTSVPGGKTFTLNNQNYTSSATDPVSGSGSLKFSKAAPKITIGWGNLLPRSGRNFSFPIEFGFAYVGDPKLAINLQGTACYDYQGQNYCSNVATNQMIQTNLAAQQQKMNKDVQPIRFFPLLSTGFAYRF